MVQNRPTFSELIQNRPSVAPQVAVRVECGDVLRLGLVRHISSGATDAAAAAAFAVVCLEDRQNGLWLMDPAVRYWCRLAMGMYYVVDGRPRQVKARMWVLDQMHATMLAEE